MHNLKHLFPHLKIPEPSWLDGKYWPIGIHYFHSRCPVEKEIQKIVEHDLPEKCRQVFILSRVENLSNKEISKKFQEIYY